MAICAATDPTLPSGCARLAQTLPSTSAEECTAHRTSAVPEGECIAARNRVRLHDLVVRFVAGNELCRRFMAIPGVGPVAALSFMTAIDDPTRFRRSRDVAAYFGLTSKRWQSGSSIDVQGRISKAGDPDMRRALYEAASALMTRFKGKDKVKSWGEGIAKRSCHR